MAEQPFRQPIAGTREARRYLQAKDFDVHAERIVDLTEDGIVPPVAMFESVSTTPSAAESTN